MEIAENSYVHHLRKKKIVFDIIHLAHLNFFKQAIQELNQQGHEIEITYLDRGKIEKVLQKELSQYQLTKIGTYSPTTLGKVGMIFSRALKFWSYLRKSKPDLTTGVGDFILAFSSRPLGIPSILFYDDFEFKLNFNLSLLFANKLVIPDSIPSSSQKVIRYPSFKELAYLHPQVYHSNKQIVKKMGLKENEYVFVREVANISLNYSQLEPESLLEPIKYLHHQGIKVILSLEDKSRRQYYEPYCLILEEPLEDVYSLISGARFMLSSGDSMAREAALLGVPCIYTGGREMLVNKPFLEWGGIYKIEPEQLVLQKIDQLLSGKTKTEWSLKIKKIIDQDLANTTQIIVDLLGK